MTFSDKELAPKGYVYPTCTEGYPLAHWKAGRCAPGGSSPELDPSWDS